MKRKQITHNVGFKCKKVNFIVFYIIECCGSKESIELHKKF